MSIVTRQTGPNAKGSPLTNTELDNNFINLDWHAANNSTGLTSIPSFVDNGGGSVTVGPAIAHLFSTTDFSGEMHAFDIAADTFSLVDKSQNYIVADYNSGSPIYKNISDVSLITESSVIPVFTIYRDGDDSCALDWDKLAQGLSNKLHARLVKTRRFERESGLELTEDATRIVNIAEGVIWAGANRIELDAVVSNVETCYLLTKTAGVWGNSIVTQYPNNIYQDTNNTASLTSNQFGVIWVYRCIADIAISRLILGTDSYNKLGQALAAGAPADVPSVISANSALVGRIVVEANADVASSIINAFDVASVLSAVPIPTDLTDLDDVDIATLTDKDLLVYSNSEEVWENVAENTVLTLDNITNINNTTTNNISINGLEGTFTAGEDLLAGDLCYLNVDGKVWKTDASAESTVVGQLIIAAEDILADASGLFLLYGKASGFTGLTTGAPCYISETAGEITQTQPTTFVRLIGFALSATTIFLSPSPDWIEV